MSDHHHLDRPHVLAGQVTGLSQDEGGTVHVRPLDRWQADDQREKLADLFVESYPPVSGEEYQRREEFLDRLGADVQREGFSMLIGETVNPVACVYGYDVDREGSWWPEFRGGLPTSIEQLTASGQIFAVADLMVHPSHRHQDVGRELLEQMLSEQQARLGVLLIDPGNASSLAALRSWGWHDIGTTAPTEDTPALQVLARPLEQSV
jgi:GNAT superfamily N-acetyltransferase